MASTSPTPADPGPRSAALLNKPQTKLPRIPKGMRIQKRPLPGPSPAARRTVPPPSASASSSTDPDGYPLPARAPHTSVLKVTSAASFMSLVARARKALEKSAPGSSSAARHAHGAGRSQPPLAARIAAVRDSTTGIGGGERGVVADAQDDVVLVATGRAIQKAVEVGGFFTRERDLVVAVRTRTVRTVDDVVAVDEEEAEGEDGVRVRGVSCVEVGIRWAS